MATIHSQKNICPSFLRTGSPIVEDRKHPIEYDKKEKISLLGSSLRSLAETVVRAVIGCIALIGYFMTFGRWEQAKDFSVKQIEKAMQAIDNACLCFRAIFSSNKSPTPKEKMEKPTTIQINALQAQKNLDEKIETIPNSKGKEEEITYKRPIINVIEIEEDFVEDSSSSIDTLGKLEWTIHKEEEIPNKLQKQFDRAQDQAAKEPDKDFKWLTPPADFEGQTHLDLIGGYEIGVCHFIGRRPTMEDNHLITSFDLSIPGKSYPVLLYGIFDGHAGDKAADHAKRELQNTLQETLSHFCSNGLTNGAIWNALKITCVKLNEAFKGPNAGTTAVISMILDDKLWTANVGDSRAILDNGIQLSEDQKPTNHYYFKGIRKRGNWVIGNRINGILATARAIGDRDIGNISARPKITMYPLSEIQSKGCLVLCCDGIYDVSSTRQIADGVATHPHEDADELAKSIVYSAYQAKSLDNLSFL